MVAPSAGAVVLVPFPFSDLSQSKLRPALVLVAAGGDDWILCQITSRSYGDPRAVPLDAADFTSGALHRASFARPGKLFTADRSIIVSIVGQLGQPTYERIRDAVIDLLRNATTP